jgi:hypothetical protein
LGHILVAMCIVHCAFHNLWPYFHKEHVRHSLGNLTIKDHVCQFLRKLDGKPILDPQRVFKPFLDVKPREDTSHNHNYLYIHMFWSKIKREREREKEWDSSWPTYRWYDCIFNFSSIKSYLLSLHFYSTHTFNIYKSV